MKPILASLMIVATFAFSSVPLLFAEDGVTPQKVTLGQSLPLTTVNKDRATRFKDGADVLFKKVNDAGGVNGRRVEVLARDDAFDPHRTVENVTRLINEDKVFLLFQLYGTPTTKAALFEIKEKRAITFAPLTSAEFTRKPVMPTIFNVRPGLDAEAREMVNFAVEKKKIRSIGVFSQDDAIGQEGVSSLQRAFNRFGLRRNGEANYKRGMLDFGKQVDELKKANPGAVAIFATFQTAAEFIRQSAAKGFHPVFLLSAGNMTAELAENVKGVNAEIYGVSSYPPIATSSAPITKQYLADARAAKSDPSDSGFEGYLNASIVIEGLKRAGDPPTREGFLKALESMRRLDVGGLEVTFGPDDHEGISTPQLVRVADGKFIPL